MIRAAISGTASLPVPQVFHHLVNVDVPTVFSGYGPMAAVVEVREQQGDWGQVGQTRKIILADGGSLVEEITAYHESELLAYQLKDLKGPLRILAREIHGEWHYYSTDKDQTRIEWQYDFLPRHVLLSPLTWLVVKTLWMAYMKRILRDAIAEVENKQ